MDDMDLMASMGARRNASRRSLVPFGHHFEPVAAHYFTDHSDRVRWQTTTSIAKKAAILSICHHEREQVRGDLRRPRVKNAKAIPLNTTVVGSGIAAVPVELIIMLPSKNPDCPRLEST